MTTYVLTVAGVDITNKVIGSINLNRALGESSATLDFTARDLNTVYAMEDVTLSVDDVTVFAGVVKEQGDGKQSGTLKISRMRCVDNTDKLQRRIVAEVFTGQTAKQMIVSLINKYASYIDTTAVQDVGGVIEELFFNYDTLADAIDKLAEISGAFWYLDANDGLHFFENYETISTTVYSGTDNIIVDSFTLKTTAVDLANRVWVIGAKNAAVNFVEQFWTGDSVNAVFTIAYEPNYPEVSEGGVPKTIEVDKGGTSTRDYVYDKKNRVLTRVAGPLPSGVALVFRYRPTIQVIDYFEDPISVSTYGLYEKAIRDKKVTDKTAARKRGRSELRKTKTIQRLPAWSTRTWDVNPGELTRVTVSSFNFDADCRIDSVNITFTPEDIIAQIEASEVFSS